MKLRDIDPVVVWFWVLFWIYAFLATLPVWLLLFQTR